jgi:hypothetical protein
LMTFIARRSSLVSARMLLRVLGLELVRRFDKPD